MHKRYISRVDRQVSIVMTIILSISILAVYLTCTYVSYLNTVGLLESQIISIFQNLENRIPLDEASKIYTKDQMDSEVYQNARSNLQTVRELANLRYLFTATKNDKGQLIYVIDGLPLKSDGTPVDVQDYRYPGDLIEPEIQKQVSTALEGTPVFPEGILDTTWGDVYVAFLPIHNKKREVVGVLGLEFSASNEVNTFTHTAILTFCIGLFFIVISTLTSIFLFRKISNPLYKDFINTDVLTNLKNRNSFEVDIGNIINSGQSNLYTVVMIDLNDLKKMNDNYGHEIGDKYISVMSSSLQAVEEMTQGIYRYGGDEFVILLNQDEDVISLATTLKQVFDEKIKDFPIKGSYSIGWTAFDKTLDNTLIDTKRRADEIMYKNKHEWHLKN